jgi:ATP-dependent Lon protease
VPLFGRDRGRSKPDVIEGSPEPTTQPEHTIEPDSQIPDDLPVLPLRGVVVYPMMWLPLTVGQPRSIRLIDATVAESRVIGLVTSRDPEIEEPSRRRSSTGCCARPMVPCA